VHSYLSSCLANSPKVVPSIMLDVQYRMHPNISLFPSIEFYDFSLRNGTVDSSGNISPWLSPPASSHLEMDAVTGNRPSVVFLDHEGAESMRDRSRVNRTEASIVCSVVEDLLLHNQVRVLQTSFSSGY
jgi:superfamily I DNA and/or RNA helicase